MRTIINSLITMLIALLISCDSGSTRDITTKNYIVERGGCADGLPPDGVVLEFQPDTLYHYINEDTLTIYIGFNDNCCIYYKDKSKVFEDSDDKIDIILMVGSDEPCFCNCYYQFYYKIAGYQNKIYNYSVLIAGKLKFIGKIDLR